MRWYMDVVKEDMGAMKLGEEDAVNRLQWRRIIRSGDP